MKRLSFTTLSGLPADVKRPGYDPRKLSVGILHLGLGAFHKAHQAVFVEDAIERAGGAWGIAAVSLRSPKARSELGPQDGLFVVEERTAGATRRRVVGSLREALFAREDLERVLALFENPAMKIISLTITEKGYSTPETLDFIVRGLSRRLALGGHPVTMLPCDNLPSNGQVLRSALLAKIQHDPRLAAYLERDVAFASTMVDRIVPATQAADLVQAEAALSVRDEGFVATEPFKQWVIEDRFATDRPAFEQAGVQLVQDVAPYEHMKLRLLNAAHSALAYQGQLLGIEYLNDVVQRPEARRFAQNLMATAVRTVHAPGVDLAAYRKNLLDRFANPRVRHRTAQIAQDGSLKIAARLLPTARELEAAGADWHPVAEAIASWLAYLRRAACAPSLKVVDPQAPTLLASATLDARGFVQAALATEPEALKIKIAGALTRLESSHSAPMSDSRELGRS